MSDTHSPEKREQKRREARKKSELSFSIALLGIVLLVTPLINAFTFSDGTPSVLSLLVYLFGIWAFIIFAALGVSRLLVTEVTKD